ncbi:nucleoside deaminase [Mucilaginibacter sp. McL0603]|uniref:nucleoside deaminase n=1 Tax=Mucilaginibacter sp. McL0603 TaxID=3415670 RepID=UPI003CE78B11
MEMQGHEKFMRIAIELSEQNVKESAGGPFGAVIVKDGVIVASSANKVVQQNDPTAHAEISAIRLACHRLGTHNLEGCIIYTSCEPCPMCLGAIYWAHIDTIYYGNTKADAASIGFDDHFIYLELERPMHQRKLQIIQLLRDEALSAFKLWGNSESKKNY